MDKVYDLSDKGMAERLAEQPTLPAELGHLLSLVDGQRTRADVLAAAGRNAVTAGGLRWLIASGYIEPATQPMPAEHDPLNTSPAAPHSRLGPTTSLDVEIRTPEQICRSLAGFMLETIGRRLGEHDFRYRQQIESATHIDQLVPLLNPLIDAIVAKAGGEAAAEFAESAAFILNPRERGRAAP